MTQAEIISSLIILAGVVGLAVTWKRRPTTKGRESEVVSTS